jgi:hypothetical protein
MKKYSHAYARIASIVVLLTAEEISSAFRDLAFRPDTPSRKPA